MNGRLVTNETLVRAAGLAAKEVSAFHHQMHETGRTQMPPCVQEAPNHPYTSAAIATAVAGLLAAAIGVARAADDPPYALAREGFFYVGGKPTVSTAAAT